MAGRRTRPTRIHAEPPFQTHEFLGGTGDVALSSWTPAFGRRQPPPKGGVGSAGNSWPQKVSPCSMPPPNGL